MSLLTKLVWDLLSSQPKSRVSPGTVGEDNNGNIIVSIVTYAGVNEYGEEDEEFQNITIGGFSAEERYELMEDLPEFYHDTSDRAYWAELRKTFCTVD